MDGTGLFIDMNKTQSIIFQDLGLIDYGTAFQIQKRRVQEVIDGALSTVLLCEHPSVLTLGRLGIDQNILWSPEELTKKGIQVIRIDRGGEVTLHAPGQLVIYPIINLNEHARDLKRYLHYLEQVAIDLLHDFGIVATRISGQRGVWVEKNKIVSIGVGVRKWVTYHGLAINVNTDLNLFSMIKPCGLDVQMTSMAKCLGRDIDMIAVKSRIKDLL